MPFWEFREVDQLAEVAQLMVGVAATILILAAKLQGPALSTCDVNSSFLSKGQERIP